MKINARSKIWNPMTNALQGETSASYFCRACCGGMREPASCQSMFVLCFLFKRCHFSSFMKNTFATWRDPYKSLHAWCGGIREPASPTKGLPGNAPGKAPGKAPGSKPSEHRVAATCQNCNPMLSKPSENYNNTFACQNLAEIEISLKSIWIVSPWHESALASQSATQALNLESVLPVVIGLTR